MGSGHLWTPLSVNMVQKKNRNEPDPKTSSSQMRNLFVTEISRSVRVVKFYLMICLDFLLISTNAGANRLDTPKKG